MIVALLACAAPEVGDLFTTLSVETLEADEASLRFIEAADGAEQTLHVSLPALSDTDLAEALVDAVDRGVEVEVTTDVDQEEDAGVALLEAAGIPVQRADGELGYHDFGTNGEVGWASEDVIMSAAMLIADRRHVVNATTAGDLGTGSRIVFDAVSNDLAYDLETEHVQLFGGADSTSLTQFSSMQKSIADLRWAYPTDSDVVLEVWLGPQERLTKRVIDAVYAARNDVRVLTNDFANRGLAAALEEKAGWGFDVEVVVGPAFGTSSADLSDLLREETANVVKLQVTDVDEVPTLVLVDFEQARDGRRHTARALVLSHDLYSASRLEGADEVVSDQLIDGNLWVLDDATGEPSDALRSLESLYEDHRATAGELP